MFGFIRKVTETVVNTGEGYVWVSTVYVPVIDKFETAVFPCNKKGSVTSWTEIEMRRADDISAAMANHKEVVSSFGTVLKDQSPNVGENDKKNLQ